MCEDISPHWAHQLGLFSHMELLLPMKQDLFQQLGWLTIYSKTWRMLPWPYKGLRHISLSHYSESDLQDSFRKHLGTKTIPQSKKKVTLEETSNPLTQLEVLGRPASQSFQLERRPGKSNTQTMIWQKRWKHAWQKKWLWSLSIFDVTVMSLANFLTVSFSICNPSGTSSPSPSAPRFSSWCFQGSLQGFWMKRKKKPGLDRRDGGPRTVLDTRWSQQNTGTAWVKAAPHRRQWLPRSLRLHAKCQECPATGGIQETQTGKAHWLAHFLWHINKRKLNFLYFLSFQDLRFQVPVPSPNWILTSISMTQWPGQRDEVPHHQVSKATHKPCQVGSFGSRTDFSWHMGKGPKRLHSEHPNRTSPTFIQRSHPLIYSDIPDSTELFMIFPKLQSICRIFLLDIYLLDLVILDLHEYFVANCRVHNLGSRENAINRRMCEESEGWEKALLSVTIFDDKFHWQILLTHFCDVLHLAKVPIHCCAAFTTVHQTRVGRRESRTINHQNKNINFFGGRTSEGRTPGYGDNPSQSLLPAFQQQKADFFVRSPICLKNNTVRILPFSGKQGVHPCPQWGNEKLDTMASVESHCFLARLLDQADTGWAMRKGRRQWGGGAAFLELSNYYLALPSVFQVFYKLKYNFIFFRALA